MLAGLHQGYRDIETRSVMDKHSDDQLSSPKSSNSTARDGPLIKATSTLAKL